MKLLNFNNLEFKWEYKKEMCFYAHIIVFKYEFKYWFGYPKSIYFRIKPKKIKWCKTNYRDYFTCPFKQLKRDIKDETS